MRRVILAVTLGGVLLSGAACSNDTKTTADAAAPAATPATATTTAAPDYTADSKKVCDGLEKELQKGAEAFGVELGKMIGYKETKQTQNAAKAKKAAATELKNWAADVKKATSAAKDPKLQAAGAEAADNLVKAAEGDAFFAKFKTEKDVDKHFETELNAWFAPLSTICE
ncbi:hypothetical protein EV385_2338 [Krasilnikovia cinnamomea]|uniref:Uncharacterized protein n=1 Tax=Krasilnikovia cinnamomea TaxID=349313 RepID=A0A4Q7ZJR8_9ACTN|nr:hypothetical protein [Krasilnikovia cinnamomea]RZU50563.1 hypothetical protein EV385_2338 [Krasilnikovia cinnamomea]